MPAKVAGDHLMDVICSICVQEVFGDHTTLSHTIVSVTAIDKVRAVNTILQEKAFYPF